MPAEKSNWRRALSADLDADAEWSSFVEGAHNNQKDREQSVRLIYWTLTQLEQNGIYGTYNEARIGDCPIIGTIG